MSNWIRTLHRWLSVVFMFAVVANLVALFRQQQEVWVGFLALAPLILLVLTGLYLFVLPYAAKWRGARGAAEPR